MADEAALRDFVTEQEREKELARLRAQEAALEGVDVMGVVADPQQYVSDVIAAVLAAIVTLLDEARDAAAVHVDDLGLDSVGEDELQAAVEEAEAEFQATLEADLPRALTPLLANVRDMLDAGLSDATISDALASPATRDSLLSSVVATVRAAAASAIVAVAGGIMARALLGAGGGNLVWVTLSSRPCDSIVANSCAPRAGMRATLAEWTALGLPRSPNLLCCSRRPQCHCQLVPEESHAGQPGTFDVTAEVKQGRAAARDQHAG
jgi:hypothetical protein